MRRLHSLPTKHDESCLKLRQVEMFDLRQKIFDRKKKIGLDILFVGQGEVVFMKRHSKKLIVPYNQRLCRLIKVDEKNNLWDLVMDIIKESWGDCRIMVDVYPEEINKKYLFMRDLLK